MSKKISFNISRQKNIQKMQLGGLGRGGYFLGERGAVTVGLQRSLCRSEGSSWRSGSAAASSGPTSRIARRSGLTRSIASPPFF